MYFSNNPQHHPSLYYYPSSNSSSNSSSNLSNSLASVSSTSSSTYVTGSGDLESGGKEWWNIAALDHVAVPRALFFDRMQEIIWVGDDTGKLTSYLHPHFEKYSCCRVCEEGNGEVKQIDTISPENLILSLSSSGLHSHTTGSLIQTYFTDKAFDNQLLTFNILPSQRVCIGGNLTKLFLMDFQMQKMIQVAEDLSQGVCVMDSRLPNILCCGGTMGELTVRDSRNLKIEHKFDVHTGTISDIACKGDLLVTCGFSDRYGELYVDNVVKAFDLRTMRLLNQIHFPAGPGFLNFHPMFYSMLCITSQTGYFQFRDVQADKNIGEPLYQIDTQGEVVQSVQFSSSGEMLMFGDGGGYIHLWTNSSKDQENEDDYYFCQINKYSVPVEIPTQKTNESLLSEDENLLLIENEIPLSAIQTYESPYLLSDWPKGLLSNMGREPPQIHPQILSNLIYQGKNFKFGYTANPGIKRVQDGLINYHTPNEMGDDEDHVDVYTRQIPRIYRRFNQNKALSTKSDFSAKNFQEFDFSQYNITRYIGLENFGMENSYVNAYIQAMYHLCPQLKMSFINHLCGRSECLSCELGFLFYMFGQLEKQVNSDRGELYQRKKTIAANNFLRTFNRLKDANGHYLLDREKPSILMNERTIRLHKFLLEQLSRETFSDPFTVRFKKQKKKKQCMIDILFGSDFHSERHCLNCGNILRQPPSHNYHYQLPIEPHHKSYSQVLQDLFSFQLNVESNFCCSACRHNRFSEVCFFSYLPNILALEFPILQNNLDLIRGSPIPTKFVVSHDPGMAWSVNTLDGYYEPKGIIYELKAILAQIWHPQSDPKDSHVVTFIRIPTAASSMWYLFNDFCVTLQHEEEVVNFNSQWKTPCLLFYTRVGMDQAVPKPPFKNPITVTKAFSTPIHFPDIQQLSPDEIPKQGDLVAIDAEFVVLNGNNRHLEETSIITSKQLTAFSLGRVTVIREKDYLPFIDDYIALNKSAEEVSDYLTRYSGLKAGDLDPTINTKNHVTTLKNTYIRLRALVDRGVIFVGHGLRNDFKIINILVPNDQIIDTVELFQLPRQRKISLRFLARHLLNIEIQSETHCSAEDARASLALYNLYKKLQKEGTFQEMLVKIYQLGRSCNWQLSPASISKNLPSVPQNTTTTTSPSPITTPSTPVTTNEEKKKK